MPSSFSLDFGAVGSGSNVSLPSGPIASGPFTVAGWLKLTAAPGGAAGLLCQGSGGVNQINVRLNNGKLNFVGDSGFAFSVLGGTVLSQGAWHHWAATYDGTTAVVYLDGTADGSGTGTPTYTNAAALLGALLGANFNLPGRLDDVRVYASALSAAQVAQLAAGANVTGESHYWPFEEGSGSTTADTVGTLTGTLSAGVTWSTDVPPQLSPPPAPTGLTATPGLVSVALSWSSSATPPVTFSVYRGIAPGTETLLDNGIAPTLYTDADVLPGTTYYYKVSATGVGGEGPQSAEVNAAVPPPGVPSGLTASVASATEIDLRWGAVAAATAYDVLRSLTPGGEAPPPLANVAGTSYADLTVRGGTAYYYKVRALITTPAGTAFGASSAEAAATPPFAAAADVIDRLNFPQPARRALTPLVTTGIAPYAVGTVLTFQGAFFLNCVYWDLTGGAATLELVDPSGNVTGPLAATITGGSPSVTYTVAAPGGQWYRKWTITDAQGRHQVSLPEAFSVDASP